MISLKQIIFTILLIIRERQLSHDSLNWRNHWDHSYDFIVVGGGTAGSVVAARLSEDYRKTVLLIEAGGPQTVRSDIPAFTDQLSGTKLDWNYTTVPQKKAFNAYINNSLNTSRGKAFGGCSMHNDMNYYRESAEFFKLWTEMTGVMNWTFSHVLPYFKKSETNLDDNIVANSPNLHVTGGPLSLTTQLPDPILKEYLRASLILGYPITYPDGRHPLGSTIMQKTIKGGVRQSASLAFLEMDHRKNLHILGQTLVTRILFNEMKRAVGVQFYRKERYYKVWARNEIVISAGSPGSPQLLLLSGVGPKSHLNNFKIPVVSDLNVGEFLHVAWSILNFEIKDQSLVEKPSDSLKNYYKYFIQKRGPLAYRGSGITTYGQVHYPGLSRIGNGVSLPRVAFMGTDLEALVKNYQLKDEWRQYYRPHLNRSFLNIEVVFTRPRQRGSIRLSSSDPLKYPIIEPCYYCNEKDLNDHVKTFELTFELFTSSTMSKVIKPFKHPIPGCNLCANQQLCDSYIRCYLQSITGSVFPVGGCRMGVANDRKAVVDQRLRVFGVSSLRVIDASVYPLTSTQTNAITFMVGEYGADMIKEDNHMKNLCVD